MPNTSEPSVILERLNQFMKYSEEHHSNHDKKLDQIVKQVKYTNGKVMANTEYRIKAQATIAFGKWLIGLLGVSNIILIIKVFL